MHLMSYLLLTYVLFCSYTYMYVSMHKQHSYTDLQYVNEALATLSVCSAHGVIVFGLPVITIMANSAWITHIVMHWCTCVQPLGLFQHACLAVSRGLPIFLRYASSFLTHKQKKQQKNAEMSSMVLCV